MTTAEPLRYAVDVTPDDVAAITDFHVPCRAASSWKRQPRAWLARGQQRPCSSRLRCA